MSDGATSSLEEVVLEAGSIRARFLTLGLALTHLERDDRNHVVGIPDPAYLREHPYVGTIIGPVANRIANGRFEIDGKSFNVATNENGNTLHGGADGFHRQVWDVIERVPTRAVFRHTMPDGHQGYPGPLDVTVTASVDPRGLTLLYEATTARPTPVSLTHHTYFAAPEGMRVDDMTLTVPAKSVTRVDDEGLPVELDSPIEENVHLDFTHGRRIGDVAIDNSYNIDAPSSKDRSRSATAATACIRSTDGDIPHRLRVETTLPAVQVFTGESLTQAGLPARSGLAVEPQFPPDLVNTARAEEVILRPGQTYRHIIRYTLISEDEPAR